MIDYRKLLDDEERLETFKRNLKLVQSIKLASEAYIGILKAGRTREDARKLGCIIQAACGDSLESFKALLALNFDYITHHIEEFAKVQINKEFAEELGNVQRDIYLQLKNKLKGGNRK
ncbi:MAG: hypothetical protein QXQ02_03670 [Halobacteria archaeon]